MSFSCLGVLVTNEQMDGLTDICTSRVAVTTENLHDGTMEVTSNNSKLPVPFFHIWHHVTFKSLKW